MPWLWVLLRLRYRKDERNDNTTSHIKNKRLTNLKMLTPTSFLTITTTTTSLLLTISFLFIQVTVTNASNHAVIPSAKVTIYPPSTLEDTTTQFLVTQAKYGPVSSMESFYQRNSVLKETSESKRLVLTPTNNQLLCSNDTSLVTTDILKEAKKRQLLIKVS